MLFGEVDYYFNNHIESIKDKDYQTVDLGFEPTSFHTLPNGSLVIACRESKALKIYDKEFKLIKTIDKINNQTFVPLYLTSNGKNSIYLTDIRSDKIIQTDLDFNFMRQFGGKGSTNQQLDYPIGITFHEDSIYVCESNNKRIQKLSEDLIYQESYPLNFKPWSIKIIRNVACIGSHREPIISLYLLNPFSFKCKISDCNCEIYAIHSWFYVINQFDLSIECYDINGNLVDYKGLENVYDEKEEIYYSFGYYNNKFIIGNDQTKNLKILSTE
jgi:hypothetical protein